MFFALIPEHEVVAIQESQYEDFMHKYGCTVLSLEFGLETPAILDLSRLVPLEVQTDYRPLYENQTSTRIPQVSRTLRAPHIIVPRHLGLIPLVIASFFDRPVVDPESHFRFIIIFKLRA